MIPWAAEAAGLSRAQASKLIEESSDRHDSLLSVDVVTVEEMLMTNLLKVQKELVDAIETYGYLERMGLGSDSLPTLQFPPCAREDPQSSSPSLRQADAAFFPSDVVLSIENDSVTVDEHSALQTPSADAVIVPSDEVSSIENDGVAADEHGTFAPSLVRTDSSRAQSLSRIRYGPRPPLPTGHHGSHSHKKSSSLTEPSASILQLPVLTQEPTEQ